MKHFLATFLIAATVANVSAEIVITPVRPTDAPKDKPGLISHDGGVGFRVVRTPDKLSPFQFYFFYPF